MEQTKKQPRVFISYAWGTDEYNEKVLLFATDLKIIGTGKSTISKVISATVKHDETNQ